MMNMFMAKFAHAAAGCRKVVLLSAVAAMALGAQASYTYTFSLDVNGPLPETMHTTYYLYDTSANTILAYAVMDELQGLYRDGSVPGSVPSAPGNQVVHDSNGGRTPTPGKVVLSYNPSGDLPSGAIIAPHTVTAIASTGGTVGGESSTWKINVSFNSEVNYTETYKEMGRPDTLEIVAVNQDREFDAYAGMPLKAGPVSWENTIDNQQNVTGGHFSGAFTYSSVPEPTSGILLLLGLTGLALRRKLA